jgi:hypothetical protein
MKIPIPKYLENNPRWRGLPIPFIALIKDDGEPDFRVTNEINRRVVMLERRCQLCGNKMGRNLFFVGGTMAAKNNRYFEPAAHLECVIYAMQVCPFICGRLEHVDPAEIQKEMDPGIIVYVNSSFTTVKNPWWVIKKALHYQFDIVTPNEILIVPVDVIYQTEPLFAEKMTAENWKKIQTELKEAK